jgi:hypothetical protein
MPQAITSPWTTSAEASSWRPDPIARATAEATAPPMLELTRDDVAQLDATMSLYDALYRWCRDGTEETHG